MTFGTPVHVSFADPARVVSKLRRLIQGGRPMGYREPVLWKEGMLLSPHHLQQQDAYHDAARALSAEGLCPFPWGLTALSFDPHALAVRKVVVLAECRGLTRMGSVINIGTGPGDIPPVESLPIRWEESASSMDVVLALPATSGGGPGEREYVPYLKPVLDPTGGRELQVEFKRPNFKLLLGNEYKAGYDTIKVAELRRDDNKLVLADDYLPPMLRIDGSRFYLQLIDALIEASRQKVTECVKLLASVTEISPDARSQAAVLLGILSGSTPVLTHCRRHGCHPERLYLELARLAGSLSGVASVDVGPVPEFDHENPYRVFSALGTGVLNVLATPLVRQSVHHAMFEPEGDHLVARFPGSLDSRKRRTFVVGVFLPPADGEGKWALQERRDKLAVQIQRHARVAATERMAAAQLGGTPLIELKTAAGPSADLSATDDYSYMELDRDSADVVRDWEPLERGGQLGLWIPRITTPSGLRFELWVS